MNSTSNSMDDDDAPIIVFLIGGPGSGRPYVLTVSFTTHSKN